MNLSLSCTTPWTKRIAVLFVSAVILGAAGVGGYLLPSAAKAVTEDGTAVSPREYPRETVVATYREMVWGQYPNQYRQIKDRTYTTLYFQNGYRLTSTDRLLESSTDAFTCYYCINHWEVY